MLYQPRKMTQRKPIETSLNQFQIIHIIHTIHARRHLANLCTFYMLKAVTAHSRHNTNSQTSLLIISSTQHYNSDKTAATIYSCQLANYKSFEQNNIPLKCRQSYRYRRDNNSLLEYHQITHSCERQNHAEHSAKVNIKLLTILAIDSPC